MSRPIISSPQPVPGPSGYAQQQGYHQQPHPLSAEHAGIPRSTSSTSHMSATATAAAGPSRAAPNVLDSNITRLLVTTKQLLQGLEHWASGQISEEDVSDIYVRLGNGFEQCVTSFHRVGIQTKELDSIPNDLRICLEQALAETASQETLNIFLPSIRDIIFSLLHGLKQKQAQYKRLLQERSERMEGAGAGGPSSASATSPLPGGHAALPPPGEHGASPSRPAVANPPLPPLPTGSAVPIPIPASGSFGRSHSPYGGRMALPEAASDGRLSARAGTSVGSLSALSDRAISPGPGTTPTKASIGSGGPPSASALAERSQQRTVTPARPAPPDAFRPPRRIAEGRRSESPALPPSGGETPPPSHAPPLPGPQRFQLSDSGPVAPALSSPAIITNTSQAPPRPQRVSRSSTDSRDSFGNPKAISRFSADSDLTNGSPIKSPVSKSPPVGITRLAEEPDPANRATHPPISSSTLNTVTAAAAPTLPTLNLPTSLSMEDMSLQSPTAEAVHQSVPPESRATLAALQRSEALERRASKRFSSYTFNKMLPSSPNAQKKASARDSPQRPSRRDRPPPLPILPDGLVRRDAVNDSVQEEDEDEDEQPSAREGGLASGARLQAISADPGHSDPRSAVSMLPVGSVRVLRTPEPEELPSRPSDGATRIQPDATPRPPGQSGVVPASVPLPPSAAAYEPDSPSRLNVYLQFGRQVKKATVDLPITLSTLRLLFMERFEYDPGMDDFPDVYLRDNSTGVQFELEDMEDLKEGCVLSLNIEPLDQVKQHFDHTFATLMNEIKEMKHALDHSRRLSMHPSPAQSAHLAVTAIGSSPLARQASNTPSVKAEPTSPSPRPTAGPTLPLTASREAELRHQTDELQSLRRDLAIMRQVHVDFLAETKESFGKLRAQNANMKEVVKTKMGGSRAILDHSKAKLERLCEDTIQAVEEVSDVIDGARLDAYKRFITPSKQQMRTIQADLKKAQELVEAFTRDVAGVETNWRATWQMELSRVMEEQKLLSHQSKLAVDLTNDIKDAAEMFSTVAEFVDQRARSGAVGSGGGSGFRPPSPEEGSGGISNLLMEIRTKEADPHQRLRAIEAQQKAREKEMANKTDDFSSELGDFVKGRKLKKTGGAEEAERMSRRRQELALKRMLTGGSSTAAGSGGGGGGGGGGSDGGSPSSMTPQTTGASFKSAATTATTATSITAPATASTTAAEGAGGVAEPAEQGDAGKDEESQKPARGSGSWEGV